MAGVKLETLRSGIKAKQYIRSMPNMAALVCKSATSLCGDASFKESAIEILSTIGRCFWVESENRWVRLRVSNAALRTIDKVGIDVVLADLRARGEA